MKHKLKIGKYYEIKYTEYLLFHTNKEDDSPTIMTLKQNEVVFVVSRKIKYVTTKREKNDFVAKYTFFILTGKNKGKNGIFSLYNSYESDYICKRFSELKI